MIRTFFFSLLCCTLLSSSLNAQKNKEPPTDPPKPVDEAKLLVQELSRLGDPELNKFLPELYWSLRTPLNATRYGRDPQAAYDTTGLMKLLKNASVRKELQIGEAQYADFNRLRDTISSKLNGNIVSRLLAEDGDFDPAKLRAQIAETRDRVAKEMEQLFLPGQYDRLKQLAYQSQMSKRSVVEVLTNDPIASELNLTDDQKEELKSAGEEIEAEFAREVAKLRAQAKQKLYSKLSKNQQRKLTQLLGPNFDYHANTPAAGFGINTPSSSAKGKQAGKGKTLPDQQKRSTQKP